MYKALVGAGVCLLALGAPTAAFAAVVINEVAWMGTSASANAEWVELKNTDSAPVSLAGWTLTSLSGTPSIGLTGSIAANGFYLLERTSDVSVPEVSADQVYSGAMANGGLTLVLKDAAGVAQDTVEGGTDWKNIGGDNTSKQTPQRTQTGWVTAVATPRAENASAAGAGGSATTTEQADTPTTTVGGSPLVNTASFGNPIPRLRIQTGAGHIVALGARTPYEVHVYDEYGTVLTNPNVTWNFGDGDVAYGRTVEHTYRALGTYTAVIHVTSGPSQSTATLTVRVDPVDVHIVRVARDGVTLHNDRDTLLDLSGWKLVAGDTSFTFPQYSVLAGSGEVTYMPHITGISSTTTEVLLRMPDGDLVTQASSREVVTQEIAPLAQTSVMQPEGRVLGIQTVEEAAPQIVIEPIPTYADATTAPDAPVRPAASGALSDSPLHPLITSPWTASFLGLLLAAGAALVIL